DVQYQSWYHLQGQLSKRCRKRGPVAFGQAGHFVPIWGRKSEDEDRPAARRPDSRFGARSGPGNEPGRERLSAVSRAGFIGGPRLIFGLGGKGYEGANLACCATLWLVTAGCWLQSYSWWAPAMLAVAAHTPPTRSSGVGRHRGDSTLRW